MMNVPHCTVHRPYFFHFYLTVPPPPHLSLTFQLVRLSSGLLIKYFTWQASYLRWRGRVSGKGRINLISWSVGWRGNLRNANHFVKNKKCIKNSPVFTPSSIHLQILSTSGVLQGKLPNFLLVFLLRSHLCFNFRPSVTLPTPPSIFYLLNLLKKFVCSFLLTCLIVIG